jgi:2-desacetyl-2-hydroxyethyl bacteriochlorophyllide A dehydrogenase
VSDRSAVVVVFPEANRVELEERDLAGLGPGEVLVRTRYSLISPGTEGIALRQLFSPGTHWADWVRYPFRPGYAAVGLVEEVGGDVDAVAVGDVVAVRRGHRSAVVVAQDECTIVPAAVDPRDATWFALAQIAFRGAQAAAYEIGSEVVIVGAGPVGQLSTRWAAVGGATSVIVADPVEARLAHARRGGATVVVAGAIDDVHDAIRAANGGEAPARLIDTTGNAAVFASVLRLAPDYGRVVLLGDTGTPEAQHLTSDVITKGLEIVGAMDGDERGIWAPPKVYDLFLNLLASGRFDVSGLITHTFTPAEAAAAYEQPVRDPGGTLGILFDWTAQ